MSLLPSLNLEDIPVEKQVPLSGPAIIGQVSQKPVSNGYVQVRLPLFFVPDKENPDNGVKRVSPEDLQEFAEVVTNRAEAKEAGLGTFEARWNLKEEWLTAEFAQRVRAGEVDQNERTSYQINLVVITRKLFQALFGRNGSIDFDQVQPGQIVGFRAAASDKEPDRLQIKTFYSV